MNIYIKKILGVSKTLSLQLSIILSLCTGITILLTTCSFSSAGNMEDTSLSPGEFWAALSAGSWYKVKAKKLAEGAHCVIYAEAGHAGLDSAISERIAGEYDSVIYPKITSAFGGIVNVGQNGKVILLLLDIKDNYDPVKNPSYIGGYFQAEHMQKRNAQHPHSNEAAMLFIDIYPQKPDSVEFYATIAHELVHLIHYSQRDAKGLSPKETWINEGLATAAEYLYSGDPSGRILRQLVVNHHLQDNITQEQQKNTFYTWDGSIEDYSTAYLFFQWLRLHAKNDKGIYKNILNDRDGGFRSVLNSAQDEFEGAGNWDWKELMKNWLLSGYYSDRPAGMPGYKNFELLNEAINKLNMSSKLISMNITVEKLAAPLNFNTEQPVSLRSGEALFSNIGSPLTLAANADNPDITYIGITPVNFYTGSNFTENDILLGFNGNISNAAAAQTATMPKGFTVPGRLNMARMAFSTEPEPKLEIKPQMIDTLYTVNPPKPDR